VTIEYKQADMCPEGQAKLNSNLSSKPTFIIVFVVSAYCGLSGM